MKARAVRILAPIVIAFCVSACMIEIKYEFPRWRCTLKCDGARQSQECVLDTYPETREYSVPEFFVMDNGGVVFRFFDKNTGLKLQAANGERFVAGTKYQFKRGDEYFDVSFDWLYNGKDFSCDSGWMIFKRNLMPNIAYTIDFEFDLSASDGSSMTISNGTFTSYYKVKPRNIDLGLK